MLPGAAELCPRTRARWSAGYRAPERQVQGLGGVGGQSILWSVGHLQEKASFRTEERKRYQLLCPLSHPHLSHLEADTG